MSSEPALIGAALSVEPSTSATMTLQRTCECGGHVSGGGECDECRRKRESGLQRYAAGSAPAVAPPIVHDVLREPGQALDRPTRRSLETSFGRDFSQIRVHTEGRAAESARAVGAAAYTVGPHVVFGAGRYAPSTPTGRRLLAHELAHTVQQAGAAAGIHPLPIRDDPSEERAAEAAAAAAARGDALGLLAAAPVGVQRQDVGTTTTTGATADAEEKATWAPPHGCITPVPWEEIEAGALLQSRAVTVIDVWASWCGPCRDLSADLDQLCKRYQARPPAAPIRFFSIDYDDPANNAIRDQYDTVPQLLVYVGPTLEYHFDHRPEFEFTEQALETAIDHAARSGAARGFSRGSSIGWKVGLAGGLLAGAGLALTGILSGGLGLLGVLGLGALGAGLGWLLGGAIGAFVGWLGDTRDIRGGARRGAFEADALIRQRFGNDIPRGTAPLHGAPVHPVTQAELKVLWECRHDPATADPDIIGWTDSGADPRRPAIATQADEPVCANGKQLEHATPAQPVIYYAKDKPDATVVIHEGLHAYEHPHFSAQVGNDMSETTTEYFTRQIAADIDAKTSSVYDKWLDSVKDLVKTIGEPALRAAYFRGDFGPANAVLGKCGLEAWGQHHLLSEQRQAAAVLEARGGDYCKSIISLPEREPSEYAAPQGAEQ